jgi:hypothetical protein
MFELWLECRYWLCLELAGSPLVVVSSEVESIQHIPTRSYDSDSHVQGPLPRIKLED